MQGQDIPLWRLLPDLPRAFPRQIPTGCSRYPMDWDSNIIGEASNDEELAQAWDYMIDGIEVELTNRYDFVGPKAISFQGRSGPPQFVWRMVKWKPPCRRITKRPTTLAWCTAAKWMGHIGRERHRLRNIMTSSQMAHACLGFTPMQCANILKALFEVNSFLANVLRSRVT